MRNFLQIAQSVDVLPVTAALYRQPDLWSRDTLRTTFENTPHGAVDDIWLRFNADVSAPLKEIGDELEMVDYSALATLPGIRPIVFDLMRRVEGTRLGRMMVTRLAPGKRILAHSDVLGGYAHYYQRYHVVLKGLPGSIFQAGEETICMMTGSVWWFNAHAEHECINNSAEDRLHLLVDIRS